MSTDRVQFDITDDVAHIRLIRADARNAIDRAMVEAFADAVEQATMPGAARSILVSAAGPSFTVGGDLAHFAGARDRLADELHDTIAGYHPALLKLAQAPVPVVCAAQGAAAGGGLGMLWASDLVIAAEDLVVATGFARLGLSGDGGSSWYLPRLVGMLRAKELILAGRVLNAAEALEWGLVSKVVPPAELEAAGLNAALGFAAGPTTGYKEMLRLLSMSWDRSLVEGLTAETAAMRETGSTLDAVEGVVAFHERRRPHFNGN
ncbi:MAG: hypothetical protein QOG62_1268 [Thermoleophilaceae bacterium]|nr:hypothetical protein [Thermoleophilaceae bacterium]